MILCATYVELEIAGTLASRMKEMLVMGSQRSGQEFHEY